MSGGVWIASYVLLWLAVLVLGATCLVLLRQIGVLHTRLRPLGVHPADEGLPPGAVAPPLPAIDFARAPLTLVAFTSPTCEICHRLVPGLDHLDAQYDDVQLVVLELTEPARPLFAAYNVRSSPYFVAVDRTGTVRGAGVANALEQVEVLLEDAAARARLAGVGT